MNAQNINIRSGAGYDLELVRLASLDSQPALDGAALVAEADGVIRAAVSLDDDRAVSDPFYASAPLVELLRLQAAQTRQGDTPRRGLALRLGRDARPAAAR